ncbi:MAG: CfrBI family restriction endonuclease [Candidatus Schekmanbacteria bacterium]|nr:CfrBI family restriction endonuclease [Candidatus Schekmanbacteria bacterium]
MKSTAITLKDLLPENFNNLLESKGATFIKRAGEENVRQVVVDVLCGNNLRASTEHLTRLRLGKINAATFIVYLRGLQVAKDFSRQIPQIAFQNLTCRATKSEKEICKWMIGLTGKGVQNVLRDDELQLKKYTESFAINLKRLATETEKDLGKLQCRVKSKSGTESILDWHDILSLFCTIGSQTLAIRGSEKSTYGKLFERLVLGSVLAALGFEQTSYPPGKTSGVFWLSSKIGEREADATLLVAPGQAIRFDLGFIGRGNPEITKDKVSRFERNLEVNKQQFHSATCIIVDRVGEGSGLEEHAKRAGARVIQMSMSYWPVELAQWLFDKFAHKADVLNCPRKDLPEFFKRKLTAVSFETFVRGLIISESEQV